MKKFTLLILIATSSSAFAMDKTCGKISEISAYNPTSMKVTLDNGNTRQVVVGAASALVTMAMGSGLEVCIGASVPGMTIAEVTVSR